MHLGLLRLIPNCYVLSLPRLIYLYWAYLGLSRLTATRTDWRKERWLCIERERERARERTIER